MKSFPQLGLKAFSIGAGDEEVFASSYKMIHQSGIRTVGETFGVCCPGLTSNFLFLKS